MEVYLVGGAVRDEQLGIRAEERDWCVVGSTPDELLEAGYRQVGKDFPVFLHPQTGEEYALARTERKTGPGYHGFSFRTSPDVSIEEDLGRRDLTINAIAKDKEGNLIDPFNGLEDIRKRRLRHVSAAFQEDPVRILRTAKFAARFADSGFKVSRDTMQLMSRMTAEGEADALVPDRVWKETEAAIVGSNPSVFFEILRECGALASVYPEIDALFGVPQPAKWHPEIDCGVHTMMVIEQAAKLSDSLDVRFAALVHDLGKATTPKDKLPSHHGHEKRSVDIILSMSKRLPIPVDCRELAVLVAEFHGHCHRAFELRPTTILKVLEHSDAFRRRERFEKLLLACEADARGRTGFEDQPYPQATFLSRALAVAETLSAADVMIEGAEGPDISVELRQKREVAIADYCDSRDPDN